MCDRDEFEKWVCEENDLEPSEVFESRSTDELGVTGYGDPDLDSDGDCLLTAMWMAWQAAGAQRGGSGEAVAKVYRDAFGAPKVEFLDLDMYVEDGMAIYAKPQPAGEGCEWHGDDNGTWMSACGKEWYFEDGGPEDNGMNYCVKCGKHCVEIGSSEDEGEDYDNAI